jgi:hypothetical protein
MNAKHFAVVPVNKLQWPLLLQLPSRRFRLFVAADARKESAQAISDFAFEALSRGMVYFSSWGPDCERFHDIVDEVVIADDLSESGFAGPSSHDVIMTTWHDDETLEEAVDFFATCAVPTEGFLPESEFRLAICLNNSDWAKQVRHRLESAKFFL